MTTSKAHRIATKVGDLHVEDAGSGSAVLLWPSLFADARTLDVIAKPLAKRHRVLVIDGPGHGKSGPPPSPFSLEDCANAAMHVLDELGVARASWIGSAWGGHVGVAAALHHPNRLDQLVVLNAPLAPWRGRHLLLLRFSQAMLRTFGPASFVARMIADKSIAPSAGPNRAELVAVVSSALQRCDPQGLRIAMASAMFEREDLIPRLGDVRVPTVFLAGTDDGLFPIEVARAQAHAIPSCRFIPVERSGHHSALERPDVVLPILEEVLFEREDRAMSAAL